MAITEADIIEVLKERQPVYGDFRVFCAKLAERWSDTVGVVFEAHDVPLLLADLKRERLASCPGHSDSALDLAAYKFMHDVLVGGKEFPDELESLPPRVSQTPTINWELPGDVNYYPNFIVGDGERWREELKRGYKD